MPCDPTHVSKHLTNCLVSRLLSLELDHKPAWFTTMLREQVDLANIRWKFVTPLFITWLCVDGPVVGKLQAIPVVQEKIVQMPLQRKALDDWRSFFT
jgi:hypothetical protein